FRREKREECLALLRLAALFAVFLLLLGFDATLVLAFLAGSLCLLAARRMRRCIRRRQGEREGERECRGSQDLRDVHTAGGVLRSSTNVHSGDFSAGVGGDRVLLRNPRLPGSPRSSIGGIRCDAPCAVTQALPFSARIFVSRRRSKSTVAFRPRIRTGRE